jgi:putative hydrolase of the HAD superfamily
MIRAVGFDLWETLITNTPELGREQERLRIDAMERILRGRGFDHAAEQIERAYRGVWERCQELYWSLDVDIPCRRQIEHFLEMLDVTGLDEATLDALEDAYARAILEVLPRAVDGVADALREIRARGLAIGMISNTGRTPGAALRDVLKKMELAPSIDAMVFSNEHGECKPRRSIFESLREALGVRAEEIVFVGDNLYVDVHGAQEAGMRGIHFIPQQRGTAVAPHVEHGKTIVPDATITDLRELANALDAIEMTSATR